MNLLTKYQPRLRVALLGAMVLLASLGAFAQTSTDLNEGLHISKDNSTGIFTLSWWGKTGRTYFVQSSLDRYTWTYLSVVKSGANAITSVQATTSDQHRLWRLRYTDAATGGNAETADFDGDKVSNLTEVQNGTDPFSNVDSDGDAVPDDWERDVGGDPNDPYDSLLDSDGDRIPNRYEYAHGTDGGNPLSYASPTFTVDPVTGVDLSGYTTKKTISGAIEAVTTAFTVIRVKAGSYANVISTNKTVLLLADTGGKVIMSYNGQVTGLSIRGANIVLRDFQIVSEGWAQDRAPVEFDLGSASNQAALINCTIRNQGVSAFAPIRVAVGTAVIVHCTIANNFTGAGTYNAGSISLYSSLSAASNQRLVVRNSILWNPQSHTANEISARVGSTVVATGNLIRGGAYGSLDLAPGLDRYGMLSSNSAAIIGGSAGSHLVSRDIHGEDRQGVADLGADEFTDSDSDDLPDWWEQNYFGNLSSASSSSDNDTPSPDGLLNKHEYQLGFDPLDPVTSGDPPVSDYLAALKMTGDAFYPAEWKVDADGDGLNAGWELYWGSSDNNKDSNGDGILDLVAFFMGFDPTETDVDGDGLDGGAELALGTSALSADTDGDGIDDGNDPFPLDPFLSGLPASDPMDMTGPAVTLTKPAEAILVP